MSERSAAARHATVKVQQLRVEDTPQDLFAKLQMNCDNAFLLESSSGAGRLAEYSFLGFDPSEVIRAADGRVEVTNHEDGATEKFGSGDPLDIVRSIVPPGVVVSPFRFGGGAVGYISYDSVRYWEELPKRSAAESGFADMEFGIYTDGVVYDHKRNQTYYWFLNRSRIHELLKLSRMQVAQGTIEFSKAKPSMTKSDFIGMVERAKEYILSGEIFQVVLSKKYESDFQGDMNRFYSALARINPSPYMYFLKFGERQIVGSSPEMLARVEENRVETFPIAGTRPRLDDEGSNRLLTSDLLKDPKEMAEHTMLVDLARNDVGKISEFGSVKVPEFGTVQQFSHVQHIVSHVVGTLREGLDSYDVLRAVFPAGTVSGAPKVRAMEIIDELEPEGRGPYAGAVGYLSFNGNADFAITIRTLVAHGRKCSVQTGAGIVADSRPEREWQETEEKAAGLLKAARLAAGYST